jgi:hypothetical protein
MVSFTYVERVEVRFEKVHGLTSQILPKKNLESKSLNQPITLLMTMEIPNGFVS